MMGKWVFVLLFLFFCSTGFTQVYSAHSLFQKFTAVKNNTQGQHYYLLVLNDAAPQRVRNIVRLNAKRQFSETFFVTDSLIYGQIPELKKYTVQFIPANNYWKLSPAVEKLKETGDKNRSFHFYIQVNGEKFSTDILQQSNFKAIKKHTVLKEQNIVSLFCSYDEIEKLFLDNDSIKFIDVIITKPKTELGTPGFDLSANKINLVHNEYPEIAGQGLHVSIKEEYYDTTDIDIKGRYEASPLASKNISNHANFMATIIAGAGNSVHYAKGAAWQAQVSSSSFEQILPDEAGYYTANSITVQNHSYGASIDNDYGLNAVAFDKSANTNPVLLHVFSSGNSGTSTSTKGMYTGIADYANLTGNFKMAKNILTVGAVDSLGNTVPLSSAGPAYDGRVKPELTAFQQNGTSEAAALVSGAAVLLQQYYQSLYSSYLPSALAKAILINSADDINAPGPDYKTGFGNLNAAKAMNLIKENTILGSIVSQNANKTFSINVPVNTALLKVTLVWNDTAATPAAPMALMNDLDLEVAMPANAQSWKPWVLNSFPHIDSLKLPATRKRDSLNNVEQVTIENPATGNYEINIDGYNVATGSQQFYVVYSIDSLYVFKWQRMTNADFAEAGTKTILRWQTSFAGNGDIEYSFADNNWLPLVTNIDLAKKYLYWNVPDTISTALLRMKIGNAYFYSDTFFVTKLLLPTTGFICSDSLLIYWDKLRDISSYQLYKTGEKYLEPFLRVADTSAVIAKNSLTDPYIAVAPVLANSLSAIKSYAFDYTKQGAGCFINSFYTDNNGSTAGLHLTMGTLMNIASIGFEKQEASGYITISSPAIAGLLQYDVNYSTLKKGINNFRVKILLKNGQVIYSNPEAVFYAAPGEYVLFPVPVKKNNDIIVISALPDGETISLLDATGRLVLQKRLLAAKDYIQTAFLQPGLYFYMVTKNGARLAAGKLIVL